MIDSVPVQYNYRSTLHSLVGFLYESEFGMDGVYIRKAKMHFLSLHFGSIPILVPKLISLQISSLKFENRF